MSDVFTSEGDLTPEEQERREQHRLAAMQRAGERMETFIEPDFFGVEDTYQFMLPGSNSQFVVIKAFNEGDRRKYLDRTNRDLKMNRTGEATLRTSPGSDRHELLKIAIVDFRFITGGVERTLMNGGQRVLDEFFTKASPSIIDAIVKEVHKRNPWLLADMSVEDIKKEIADLEEMLREKEKQEALDAQF